MNFDGVFVYRQGDKLEATMRIIHRVSDGRVRERLVSLNGAPREIIRTDREIQCYLPDENSVVVEHRKAGDNNFPTILPQQLSDLDSNYTFQVGRSGRVAEREAQLVIIKPKDKFRYGYDLWADKATGLLLRADLIDQAGNTVEQFLFTQIRPGANITEADLRPQFSKKNSVWHRENGDDTSTAKPTWSATQLPPGFKLSTHIVRKVPSRQKTVEHLVYSDGLAAVSVFVEKLARDAKRGNDGPSRMGAVNAYVKVHNDHQVTVVGEVPSATVDSIGQSVKPLQ